MTDNIKAKGDKLIEKFWDVEKLGYSSDNGYSMWSTELINKQAIQCAIIAVEEIIKDEKYICSICDPHDEEMILDQIKFWNEVLNYLKSKQ